MTTSFIGWWLWLPILLTVAPATLGIRWGLRREWDGVVVTFGMVVLCWALVLYGRYTA